MKRISIPVSKEVEDAIVRLSEGVPGAVVVLCRLVRSAHNPLEAELMCHALELMPLTGSRIWREYKDVHGEDITVFRQAIFLWIEGQARQAK